MVGKTLGHYRILEKLGEGGMGEVYLARDTKLDRKIALKVLSAPMASDPERLERFQREAKVVAGLSHPNIVTLFSVEEAEGLHFLTMELVEGKSLDQVISPEGMATARIFEIAVPLADALSAAHQKEIVHRDLKPGNVMIGKAGRVKILDFGLAKLRAEEAPAAGPEAPTEVITEDGRVMGTVPYMSPEQLGGGDVDHRSDIFSLGVILYEMAVGRRPFRGKSSGHLISAILRDDPTPVTEVRRELPFHLGRIIRLCLEKDPSRRYQSALDIRNELEALRKEVESGTSRPGLIETRTTVSGRGRRWWPLAAAAGLAVLLGLLWWVQGERPGEEGPTPPEAVAARAKAARKIVILPFENLGPPEDGYFAAGVTEEITTRLASFSGLSVISRNTALRYSSREKSIQEIGQELGVGYVLEGTVQWARSPGDSRVRITPQLIRATDDTHVWSKTYDRVLEDVFEVQSDIAEKVIGEIGVTLLAAEQRTPASRPTRNLEAYQAYLRALDYARQLDFERLELAPEMFERAVELDPDFTLAWAHLVRIYANRHFGSDLREDWLAKATHARERALELAPEDPAVRLAEGFYQYYGQREYEAALEIFEEVVERRPNDTEALAARSYIYRRLGRLDEALAEMEHALELDPQNVQLVVTIAEIYRAQRRFAEADRYFDLGISLVPDQHTFYLQKARNLTAWKGETDEARAILEGMPQSEELYLPWVELDCWDRDFESALARLERSSPRYPFDEMNLPFQTGIVYVYMGQPELGRAYLEETLEMLEDAIETAPAEGVLPGARAVLHALLGQPLKAVREAERAVERGRKDPWAGPGELERLTIIYALVGESEKAIDLLEDLLSREYSHSVTIAQLRGHPIWDPLRDHPRFQELLERRD